MSKRELIDAYLSGAITRRSFVQGLTALGLSASAAGAYAIALRPATAQTVDDLYYDFYPAPTPPEQPQCLPKKQAKKARHCKNGGFARFCFNSQRECIRFVERHDKDKHGKD